MKIWVDDVRPALYGYYQAYSTRQAINLIKAFEFYFEHDIYDDETIELIDIDHDAGDYANDGGDYIKLLDWLEETGRNYPIRIHSMNPVGRENMRRIIKRNNWTEIM